MSPAQKRECLNAVGRSGTIMQGRLTIAVKVIAAKMPYGTMLYTVRQADGTGETIQVREYHPDTKPGGFRFSEEAKQ